MSAHEHGADIAFGLRAVAAGTLRCENFSSGRDISRTFRQSTAIGGNSRRKLAKLLWCRRPSHAKRGRLRRQRVRHSQNDQCDRVTPPH